MDIFDKIKDQFIWNWQEIIWYEWKYWISDKWEVATLIYWSKDNVSLLSQSTQNKGYKLVDLYKNGKRKRQSVHRLVWQAFLWLNISDTKIFVCHKDDNPLNNNVDNLFLWTRSDNMRDCVNKWRLYLLWQNQSGWDNHNSTSVLQYNKKGEFIKEWDSIADAVRKLWLHQSNISKCCKGEYTHSWGFIWKYN